MTINSLYEKGRQCFLGASINWLGTASTSPAVALVGSGYSVDLVAHDFYNDVGANIVASAILTSLTGSDGVADAADVTFSNVAAVNNTAASRIVLFNWTGTTTTSQLIAYIDTATGLPVTPNGGNITITWDSGTCRIFRL